MSTESKPHFPRIEPYPPQPGRERASVSGEIVTGTTAAPKPPLPSGRPGSVDRKGRPTSAAQAWLLVGSSAAVTAVIGFWLLEQGHRAPASRTPMVAPERVHPRVVPLEAMATPPPSPVAPEPTDAETTARVPRKPPPPARPRARPRAPAVTEQRAAVAPEPPAMPAVGEPPQAASEPGYLTLDSAPWAEVSISGKPLGSTPLLRIPLPPGRHTLTLSNPELGVSTTYVVEIEPGATVSRFVGWERP